MNFRRGGMLPHILMVMLALPLVCDAAVRGVCSDCHTMHNSQQTTVVAFSRDSSGQKVLRDTAFGNLLKTDCVGCHSSAGPETIVTMGDSRVPVVFNMTEPTYPPDGSSSSVLAGGNFYWVVRAGDSHGHNVHGIAAQDSRFPGLAPGGATRTEDCTDCHGTLSTAQSGCNGCHAPFHHADGKSLVAGQKEGWYRFLGSVMQRDGLPVPPAEGVAGIEATDWEQNPLANRHNVYQGKPGPYVSYLETASVNQKCAGCHGLFHSQTAADAAWIRHPADTAIPDSGEFTGFSTYDPMVPVARQNVTGEDADFSTINRGSDLVACVSCHRPHGSPYPAMMRWGYRSWPGNDPHTGQPAFNGCAVCHTSKG